MALQSDALSNLITIDKDYLSRIDLRRDLLARYADTVHGCLPEGAEAVREVYTFLLRDYLPRRFPSMFALSRNSQSLTNTVTQRTYPCTPAKAKTDTAAAAAAAAAAEALTSLAEIVEEDMFILRETPDGHRCVAFLCCFPSGFDPSSKLGKLLREVHAPVPAYDRIGQSMERFFARLEVGKGVRRVNWSVQTHPELFDCHRNHTVNDSTDGLASGRIDMSKTYLRVELQTLTRLPETRAILFSFKTYMYPMRDIREEGSGPALADAIEGLKLGNAPGMWVYKSSARWGPEVCEYLRA